MWAYGSRGAHVQDGRGSVVTRSGSGLIRSLRHTKEAQSEGEVGWACPSPRLPPTGFHVLAHPWPLTQHHQWRSKCSHTQACRRHFSFKAPRSRCRPLLQGPLTPFLILLRQLSRRLGTQPLLSCYMTSSLTGACDVMTPAVMRAWRWVRPP